MAGFQTKAKGPFKPAPAKTSGAPQGDNNNPPSKPTHSLKFKDANGEYVQICNLFTNVSKAGETYLKGKDENGQSFYVMVRTPKKED
jgi:hypothetical protein